MEAKSLNEGREDLCFFVFMMFFGKEEGLDSRIWTCL